MSVLLRPTDGSPPVAFDASTREAESGDAEISRHPLEQGASVTDHVQARPRVLRIDGIFSDASGADEGPGGALRLYQRLDGWRIAGQALHVTTVRARYENFAISHLGWPNDVQASDTVSFSVVLEEVLFVSSQVVEVRASPKDVRKGGLQQPVPVEPTEMVSGAAQMRDSLLKGKGFFQAGMDGARVIANGHRGLK